jgi:hypothetical protein
VTKISSSDLLLTAVGTAYPIPPFLRFFHFGKLGFDLGVPCLLYGVALCPIPLKPLRPRPIVPTKMHHWCVWRVLTHMPARRARARAPISTFHGFNTPTPRTGRLIDEIFTRGVRLEDAALKRTDLDALPNCATAHNGLYADVIMGF